MFQQQNDRFVNLLQQCPFPSRNITVIYKQCYLPTISYPLPATAMPADKLCKLQSPATSIFLSKMGYPQTFPRAIVYAASEHGGIGFHHLGHEQGIQKCLQVLKHLCTSTSTGSMYQILIQHYHLLSGLSQSVLIDTHKLSWSNARWMDNLRSFLHSINGQITLCEHGLSNLAARRINLLWKMYWLTTSRSDR